MGTDLDDRDSRAPRRDDRPVPEPAAFLREAKAFLDAHATLRRQENLVWGSGPDAVTMYPEQTAAEEAEEVAAAKRWKALEFDVGLGWLTGPPEFGGRGLPAFYEREYRTLRAAYDIPTLAPFSISLGMVAPTILAHGTPAVRDAYLARLHRGDLIGCQLFSEPGAGSDLAGLTTRAVRDGDGWVVNGQKVWTSRAHFSDIGEILCRTDPDAPKHRGITAFIVDMRAPGVEIRPLRQMSGGSHFNEVFFTDVRIPDTHRLGAVDDGWRVAITTLMNERTLGADPDVYGVQKALRMLLLLAQHEGAADPLFRQDIAECFTAARLIEWNARRADERRATGQPPGPEDSIFKLTSTNALRRISAVPGRVLGPRMVADSGSWGTYAWQEFVVRAVGHRIAAGTDEVMRTILAERVLGLPKEPST